MAWEVSFMIHGSWFFPSSSMTEEPSEPVQFQSLFRLALGEGMVI